MKVKEVLEKNNITIPLTKEILDYDIFPHDYKFLKMTQKDNKYVLYFEDNVELRFDLDSSDNYCVWYCLFENEYEKHALAYGLNRYGEDTWET